MRHLNLYLIITSFDALGFISIYYNILLIKNLNYIATAFWLYVLNNWWIFLISANPVYTNGCKIGLIILIKSDYSIENIILS